MALGRGEWCRCAGFDKQTGNLFRRQQAASVLSVSLKQKPKHSVHPPSFSQICSALPSIRPPHPAPPPTPPAIASQPASQPTLPSPHPGPARHSPAQLQLQPSPAQPNSTRLDSIGPHLKQSISKYTTHIGRTRMLPSACSDGEGQRRLRGDEERGGE